jgi:hypothetical protein
MTGVSSEELQLRTFLVGSGMSMFWLLPFGEEGSNMLWYSASLTVDDDDSLPSLSSQQEEREVSAMLFRRSRQLQVSVSLMV